MTPAQPQKPAQNDVTKKRSICYVAATTKHATTKIAYPPRPLHFLPTAVDFLSLFHHLPQTISSSFRTVIMYEQKKKEKQTETKQR